MNRAGTIVYLAAVGLLTFVLAALWLAPGPQARWRQWQAPAPQAPQLDDVQAAQLRPNPAATANYPGVVQRPLFSPDRRPVAAASAAAPAAPPVAIEQVRLQGLVAGPSLTGVMLEEQGKTRFVRVGETVADWKLERVQARAALFSRALTHPPRPWRGRAVWLAPLRARPHRADLRMAWRHRPRQRPVSMRRPCLRPPQLPPPARPRRPGRLRPPTVQPCAAAASVVARRCLPPVQTNRCADRHSSCNPIHCPIDCSHDQVILLHGFGADLRGRPDGLRSA